jgi:hypothetical protein
MIFLILSFIALPFLALAIYIRIGYSLLDDEQ